MTAHNPASKTVTKAEAQARFDEIIAQVAAGEVELTIEEDGRPIAMLVPFDLSARQRVARERIRLAFEEMQEAANLSPEEAEDLALEAVRAVRTGSKRE